MRFIRKLPVGHLGSIPMGKCCLLLAMMSLSRGRSYRRDSLTPSGVLQHFLLSSSQLVKEPCFRAPAMSSQRRQLRIDLGVRSNQLRTGTVHAGRK